MFLTRLWCRAAGHLQKEATPAQARPAERSPRPMPDGTVHAPSGRSARSKSGALLRAVTAGLFALAAFAATAHAAVLVSNIEKNEDARATLDNRLIGWSHAQGFTTGDNPTGYTLTSIEIYFHNTTDEMTPTVTVHKTRPIGPLIDTLTGPADVSGSETFTASSNITLEPLTEYFVVLEGNTLTVGLRVSMTNANDEDTVGEDDWSINDVGHIRQARSPGAFLEWHQTKRIRVNGTVRSAVALLPGEIWGSTVVAKTHSSNTTVGYGSNFTGSTSSSTQFTHSSMTYTVEQVYNTASAGSVSIFLIPHPAATDVSDLFLKIGDEVLLFSAATRDSDELYLDGQQQMEQRQHAVFRCRIHHHEDRQKRRRHGQADDPGSECLSRACGPVCGCRPHR